MTNKQNDNNSWNALIPSLIALGAIGVLFVILEAVRVISSQVTGRDDITLVGLVNAVLPVLTTALIALVGLLVREVLNQRDAR